jgi:hypothetical protein
VELHECCVLRVARWKGSELRTAQALYPIDRIRLWSNESRFAIFPIRINISYMNTS